MHSAQQLDIGCTSVSNPVGCIMNTAQHLHIHRGCNRPPKIPSTITSRYLPDMLIRNKLFSPYLEEGVVEEGARAGR